MELEGIEPSSKQGRPVLSTRLSQPSVFECGQDLGHQSAPYPHELHPSCEAIMGYPRFSCATLPGRFGATAPEWHLVSAPGAEIKPEIYCTSIRQRERSFFRQIIFGNHWLKRAVANSLRAYTTPHPAVKSSQPRCAYALQTAKVDKNISFFVGKQKKSMLFCNNLT